MIFRKPPFSIYTCFATMYFSQTRKILFFFLFYYFSLRNVWVLTMVLVLVCVPNSSKWFFGIIYIHMRHVQYIYLDFFHIFTKCVCIAYSMNVLLLLFGTSCVFSFSGFSKKKNRFFCFHSFCSFVFECQQCYILYAEMTSTEPFLWKKGLFSGTL